MIEKLKTQLLGWKHTQDQVKSLPNRTSKAIDQTPSSATTPGNQKGKRKQVFFWILLFLMTVTTLLGIDQIPAHLMSSMRDTRRYRQEVIRHAESDWRNELSHPFRGYILNSTAAEHVNDMGLKGPLPPEQFDPGQRVVAVFGGSFSKDLAYDLDKGIALAKELAPLSQGRKIRIVCGANDGYKQPEEFQTFLEMLESGYHLDDVVLISGFNQVALFPNENLLHGVNYRYPNSWHRRNKPITTTFVDRYVLAQAFSLPVVNTSSTANVAWKHFNSKTYGKSYWDSIRPYKVVPHPRNGPPDFFYCPDTVSPDERKTKEHTMYQALAEQWAFYIELMNNICLKRGIQFHPFLQANQYDISDPLFRTVNAAFISGDQPAKPHVEKGYPYLRAAMERLKDKGIVVVDLKNIFHGLDVPVFRDTQSHLNEYGNQILGKAVARYCGNAQ